MGPAIPYLARAAGGAGDCSVRPRRRASWLACPASGAPQVPVLTTASPVPTWNRTMILPALVTAGPNEGASTNSGVAQLRPSFDCRYHVPMEVALRENAARRTPP